ncbi:MAG: methyltransferase domain-containing protein [Gemmatimonadota bacterium]|nr:methyltransferase domain-containing protein [Gemmatimonadota bacterium]
MRAAPQYNQWQYRVIAPYLGQRVLEVGSGIGTISAHIMGDARELVILTDTDPWYCDRLRSQFGNCARVELLTLPDPGAASRFATDKLDTVVALNVVEHIADDVGTLATMREMVVPDGRVIILVPALEALYGSLDRELGHYRRYTRASLSSALTGAGLAVERLEWFNRVGALGWWFNSRVRKSSRIPIEQLRLFDAVVPLMQLEQALPIPFGQSLIAVGKRK